MPLLRYCLHARTSTWLGPLLMTLLLLCGSTVYAQQSTSAPLSTKAEVTSASDTVGNAAQAAGAVAAHLPDYAAARATGILILFIIIAVLIATRKLPAMIALPIMALGIGIIAGVPFSGDNGILAAILEGKTASTAAPTGSFQLYKAIIWVLFGGIFARFISDARIAERIVKYAAEFGGENPFNVALLMSAITIMIFTAAGGLPMIIMLGTVMFPILLSLGVSASVCGSILLLAFPIGAGLNPSEWARISEVFSVSLAKVKAYSLTWVSLQIVVMVLFLTVEFLRMKRLSLGPADILKSLLRFVLVSALLAIILFIEPLLHFFNLEESGAAKAVIHGRHLAGSGFQYLAAAILVWGVVNSQLRYHLLKKPSGNWALLTPVLPLILLLGLGFGNAFIPAFMTALAYGVLTSPQPQSLQKLGRSIINGVADVAAPVILMVGIGMLIASATHPMVESLLTPIIGPIIPTTPWGYVIFFFLASPLSLYRGPLNSFGLGIGIARLMQNFMPPAATMGALQSVSMLQDPTTTQNVWICGFLKLDINALLLKLFFYSMALVILGLTLSAFMFFP